MSERVFPVTIEVAPLIKTYAADMLAKTVDFMQTQPVTNPERWLNMRTVRLDRAVPDEYRSGQMQILNYTRAVMSFRPEAYHTELSNKHIEQARTLVGWLALHPFGEPEIQEIKMMDRLAATFTSDDLRWKVVPPEERLLPDHKLPSDQDRPGELAVAAHSLFHGETEHDETGKVIHRALLFNGLGGTETIFPPAVAGIYELRRV